MFAYAVIVSCAAIFYYIGENEHNGKGWLFAIISGVLSLCVGHFTPSGFIGIVGVNAVLYIALLLFNLFSKKPPRSQSGF